MSATEGFIASVLSVLGVRRKPKPINVAVVADKPSAEIIAMVPAAPTTTNATRHGPRPRDASALALIEYMVACGDEGRWQFASLWDAYGDVCDHFDLKPISIQAFRLGLNEIGLAKGQLDLRRNGRRYRPTYFVIPSRDEFASRQKIKARLAGRALCA